MNKGLLLITGSAGLIGRNLIRRIRLKDWRVLGVDLKKLHSDIQLDICDEERVASLLPGVTGIVHLAGVSRVIDGERDPSRCKLVNVEGTNGILRRASEASMRPWIIFASSREIYGQQRHLPVSEEASPRPMNAYAHSKLMAERLVLNSGLRGAVLRFSSVYGDHLDHADRVTPAFCSAAAAGGDIRIDGKDNGFDFTHIDDVAEGICRVIELVDSSSSMVAPTHFVSGELCTLGQLAELAIAAAGRSCRITDAPPRTFDVSRFVGDPSRAAQVIGWRSSTTLESGVRRLVRDFSNQVTA